MATLEYWLLNCSGLPRRFQFRSGADQTRKMSNNTCLGPLRCYAPRRRTKSTKISQQYVIVKIYPTALQISSWVTASYIRISHFLSRHAHPKPTTNARTPQLTRRGASRFRMRDIKCVSDVNMTLASWQRLHRYARAPFLRGAESPIARWLFAVGCWAAGGVTMTESSFSSIYICFHVPHPHRENQRGRGCIASDSALDRSSRQSQPARTILYCA